MEKCYENLLKYFVFLCNLIFALAGACLVGFGAYVQVFIKSFCFDIFLSFEAQKICIDQLWRPGGVHW